MRFVFWSAFALAIVAHVAIINDAWFLAPAAGTTLLMSMLLIAGCSAGIAAVLAMRGRRRVPAGLVVLLTLLVIGRTLTFALQHPHGGGGWRRAYTSASGFTYVNHREAWRETSKACTLAQTVSADERRALFGAVDTDALCQRGAVLPLVSLDGTANRQTIWAVALAVLALVGGMLIGSDVRARRVLASALAAPTTAVILLALLAFMRLTSPGQLTDQRMAVSLLLVPVFVLVIAANAAELAPRLASLAEVVPRRILGVTLLLGATEAMLLLPPSRADFGVALVLGVGAAATLLATLPRAWVWSVPLGATMILAALVVDARTLKLSTRLDAVVGARADAPADAAATAALIDVTQQMRTSNTQVLKGGLLGAGLGTTPAGLDPAFFSDTAALVVLADGGLALLVAVIALVLLYVAHTDASVEASRDPFVRAVTRGMLCALGVQWYFALMLPFGAAPLAGLGAPLLVAGSGSSLVTTLAAAGLMAGCGLETVPLEPDE